MKKNIQIIKHHIKKRCKNSLQHSQSLTFEVGRTQQRLPTLTLRAMKNIVTYKGKS